MPSGAEWLIVVNLAIWALAIYGVVCLVRAIKVRRRGHSERPGRPASRPAFVAQRADAVASE